LTEGQIEQLKSLIEDGDKRILDEKVKYGCLEKENKKLL
jgi:hypothetical protein